MPARDGASAAAEFMTFLNGFVRSLVTAAILAFGAGGALAQGERVTPEQATQFVQRLADGALAALSDSARSEDAREQAVRDLLRTEFALDYIGQVALGRAARTLTPEQSTRYKAAFAEFALLRYSNYLGGYQNQTFTILRANEVQPRDVFVVSRLEAAGIQPVNAEWRVRILDGAPKVIDLRLEQISQTITLQEEFTAIIEREGVDGLIATLERLIAELRAAG